PGLFRVKGQGRAAPGADRGGVSTSRGAADDEIGELAQAIGAIVERLQRGVGADALLLRHFMRAREAIDSRKGDLVLLRVFAGGFAEMLGGLLDVEDVVDDLKREADGLAVFRQRAQLRVVGTGVDAA